MGLCVICICVLAVSIVSAIEPSSVPPLPWEESGALQSSHVYQARGHQNVTVCPNDYSPHDGCVTLDQLLSADLIKSNTVFKFVPATFKMKQDLVIRFENVSNIILRGAGAIIYCDGKNAGFVFHNLSEVVVHNMKFLGCAANMYEHTTTSPYWHQKSFSSCTFRVTESFNIVFKSLEFRNVHGCGIYYSSAISSGYFRVLNSLFAGIHGAGVAFYSISAYSSHVTIAGSRFQDSHCSPSYNFIACAFQMLFVSNSVVRIEIMGVTITNNTRTSNMHGVLVQSLMGPAIEVVSTYIWQSEFVYSNNRVVDSNNYLSELYYNLFLPYQLGIAIRKSSFINNSFTGSVPKLSTYRSGPSAVLRITIQTYRGGTAKIVVSKSVISNCTGWYNSVFSIEAKGQSLDSGRQFYSLYVTDSAIANNVISSPVPFYQTTGTVYSKSFTIAISDSSIVKNSATGLLIENSDITFSGRTVLRGNHGYNGGGMALYGKSTVSLSNATVLFEGNVAENVGGGLYAQLDRSLHIDCFLNIVSMSTFEFRSNVAIKAGRDWYGGHMYMCKHYPTQQTGLRYLANVIHSHDVEMNSDPWHVCYCTNSSEDCINVVRTIHRVQTYPGQLFNLSLIAVGTVLNTTTLFGVPSAIYAGLLPPDSSNPGRVSNDSLVHAGERDCSELSYRIISTNQQEVMVLSTDNNINKIPRFYLSLWKLSLPRWHEFVKTRKSTVPAYVEIELLPCPIGFESPAGECTCLDFLTKYVINCSIDTMLINRRSHTWISYHIMFLAHRHCPFDYCKPGEVEFSLDSPDAQCSGHRSGVLCGECKPGYSLTLGRSECRQCTNLYLLLLIPFALAGVLLIAFLSLTDMTVTAGTINGLLFFANIVRENHTTFFPPQAADSFLSVFIAWLNLDVGITTCFYGGLDSYVFTWLQFSFPIYIWFLAFSIIIASRHVDFVSKLYGRNIVPVLATLFLLSYTKLQRTISASLSFTVVDVSNGDKNFVWLEDGNVHYLQGKHIPLFLVSILFLIILFIPYTLSVMLGPWLQTKTQYRVFCWVLKLKPFFDACFGPLKDKHRYWTGVLLVSRIILSLVSTGNVLGDDSVNLVAIATLVIILLALQGQAGGVYKTWILTLLESFFLANLGILALVTLYNKESGGSQYASVCVSTGSAFAVFCLIVLYHCIKSIRVFVRQFKRSNQVESNNSDDAESDDELLDTIDRGRENQYNQAMHIIVEEWYNKAHDPDTY